MSAATWRMLVTGVCDGPMNMAIDQAIMEAVAADRVLPTLRFYAWEPPCLSLGYTQPLADVDQHQLAAQGWHLVRRLTGGRAILHTDELTYSVALKANDPIVAGDIVESYRRLSRALLEALHRLGASAEADRRAESIANTKGPVCFEVPSHYEITVNHKKLIGSAQVRRFGAVLQHGSFPLWGDIARIVDVLAFEDAEKQAAACARVYQRATTLEEALGRVVSWDEAASITADCFHDIFDVELEIGNTLTPAEQARAAELCTTQYATHDWNGRF
ncbi:MAG TPA: biotin/lipoate A/B protein ligase family protein [Aggregatilineaceae bacterium]|nr:biotin/lipoate A/B protein ligase family protein [Aggregatilineaceae bacterium]